MATLDAKHVFTGVASFHSSKPKSKQDHLHSFPPLFEIHKWKWKRKISSIVHKHNLWMLATLKSRLDFLSHVMQVWNNHWTYLILTTPKSLETLLLVVTYWVVLLIACPKHASANGIELKQAQHLTWNSWLQGCGHGYQVGSLIFDITQNLCCETKYFQESFQLLC
jgi:hypothetical protein